MKYFLPDTKEQCERNSNCIACDKLKAESQICIPNKYVLCTLTKQIKKKMNNNTLNVCRYKHMYLGMAAITAELDFEHFQIQHFKGN